MQHNINGTNVFCNVSLSEQFLKILSYTGNNENNIILESSLSGSTYDGVNINIERMGLDRISINSDKPGKIIFENTDDTSNLNLQILSDMGKGILYFKPFSDIKVNYLPNTSSDYDSLIMVRWTIVNFEFMGYTMDNMNRNSFSLHVDGFKFQFFPAIEYHQQLEELDKSQGTDITSEVETVTKLSRLPTAYNVLIGICWIFSFLTLNWTMPIYCDILKNGKAIQSILYNNAMPYGFLKGRYFVKVYNDKNNSFLLLDLLKKTL